jgi:hypothetical protein
MSFEVKKVQMMWTIIDANSLGARTVEKSLGLLMETHGMKCPALRTFSGIRV